MTTTHDLKNANTAWDAIESERLARGGAAVTPRRASSHGGFGWVRDLPDARDFTYSAPLFQFRQGLPAFVDLRSACPAVYDQGPLGSCTANAIAGAVEFDLLKQGASDFTPSRLFIYYNERAIEGTIAQDSGAQLRDGIKSVAKLGAPPETDWPYDIGQFAHRPSRKAYHDAKKELATAYFSVPQVVSQMQGCLAEGYPFVFGFTVYESFESDAVAKSGVVPMPGSGESVLGGHAVMAVGYFNQDRCFIVRNSWGTGWGARVTS